MDFHDARRKLISDRYQLIVGRGGVGHEAKRQKKCEAWEYIAEREKEGGRNKEENW